MTPTEMERKLKKNGFVFVRSNGSHRIYENPTTKKSTVVPFHSKELKKGLEQGILKQAGLK
jgi:predicted RNA binding protein YcfA (HicA-like mRNA interferase family)